MKRALKALIVTGAAVGAMVSMAGFTPAAAQATASQTTAAPGPAPRTADGHPDLSGVWWPGRDLPVRPLGNPGQSVTVRLSPANFKDYLANR